MPRALRNWLAVLAVGFLVCFFAEWTRPASDTLQIAPIDPAKMDFLSLCAAYQRGRADKLLAELWKRHEVPPQDWQYVISGQIYVGMSRSGLVCVRGWPDDVHSTTTNYGVTDWYSYASPRLLVRLDDGKVESFTD